MKKIKYFLPATIWLLVILFLSGYPGDKVPKISVWQFDKLVHSIMYAALTFFLLLAFTSQYKLPHKRYSLVIQLVCFAVFYGGLMEILQQYIFINRSGSWLDFIANTFGAFLGIFIYPFVIKVIPLNKWLG